MTFPTTNQSVESVFIPQDGIQTTTSAGGVTLARDDYQGRQTGTFQLVYRAVTEAEKEAFFTEYENDSLTQFTFVWPEDSTTHTVIYTGQPIAVHRTDAYQRWDVFVVLAKVPEFGFILDQGGEAIEDQGGTEIEAQAA